MYFYVDESGQTGKNLFDPAQPILYYGVLSSKVNLDLLAQPHLEAIKRMLGVKTIHGADLSNEKLALLVPVILRLKKKYGLKFDFYRVVKKHYAVISFFNQVFDSGINPAVSSSIYSTSMRHYVILKLSELFDEETLKISWSARTELNSKKAEHQLTTVCQILMDRVATWTDDESRNVIKSALQWAKENPGAIQYNTTSSDDLLQATPNLVGFQLVISGITARLLKNKRSASKITVDKQLQFNKAQDWLMETYQKIAKIKPSIEIEFGLPRISLKNLPTTPFTFEESKNSAGLELVDLFLWVLNRYNKGDLSPLLMPLIRTLRHYFTDDLSIETTLERWAKEGSRPI